MTIREALLKDVEEIIDIYRPYVLETAITFEYEVPDVEEMEKRIREREGRYPFLVAEENGRVLGYAYLSPFKERSAYDWSAETSIYIRREERGRGLGSALLSALEKESRKMNLLSLEACIAIPHSSPDSHLTDESVKFHERKGYVRRAYFPSSGYKFNSWYDMVWMEKELNPHTVPPKSVIWYGMVEDKLRWACL